MPYTTPAEVRKAVSVTSDGSLPTTQTHTAADLADEILQDAIAEADSTIDAYIGRFYTTPVPNDPDTNATPHPIDFWSRNIAAYNATLSFRGSADFTDQDPVARRYNATMQALQAVKAGTAQLNLGMNTTDSSAAAAGDPINPFVGDLFTVDEFDLQQPMHDPVYGPGVPFGFWLGGLR